MEENEYQVQGYKSYWLRCWYGKCRTATASGNWHFSLEDPHSGHKKGFSDIYALVSFLESELDREILGVKAERMSGQSPSHE